MGDFLTLGHGSGGRLTNDLVRRITAEFPAPETPSAFEDCAYLPGGYAMTLDGFTVSPRVFPGGDIGKLSICGSVNDLAVRGVRPEWIAMGLILEEGIAEEEVIGYMRSAAHVCEELGITLTCGDTKVVPHGTADGVFITTCATGRRETARNLGMHALRPGDHLVLSRSFGRHGATIAAQRFDLDVPELASDCAPLWEPARALLDIGGLRCMRDCTRGGMGTVLCEWAEGAGIGIEIREDDLPRDSDVLSVCDILGFDPLYLACEGCMIAAVSAEDADTVLSRLAQFAPCSGAADIGVVTEGHPGLVGMRTHIGGHRVVDMPVGEILPRIC